MSDLDREKAFGSIVLKWLDDKTADITYDWMESNRVIAKILSITARAQEKIRNGQSPEDWRSTYLKLTLEIQNLALDYVADCSVLTNTDPEVCDVDEFGKEFGVDISWFGGDK